MVFDTKILNASRGRVPTSRFERASGEGFTLTELIVTLAIVAIVTAFAIPSFSINTPSMEANELLGAFQYARFAAIKNAQNVIVCPAASGSSTKCSTSSAWNTGWLVLAPASGLCSATGGASGDVVLKSQSGFGSTDTATFSPGSGGSNTSICFNRIGFVSSSSTGLVTIKTSPSKTKLERCVAVSGVGHMQVLSYGQTDINSVQCL